MDQLAKKTVMSFVWLLLGLGVLIFIPAGTIRYWQAWVFIAVFVGTGIIITAYLGVTDPQLLERRLSAGPTAETETRQKIIMSFAYVAIFGLAVVPGLDHRFGWSNVPFAGVIAGDVVVVIGAMFVLRVFRENTYTAATIQVAAEQRVISTGPYALVRHPMYTGSLLMLLGVPPALGSWWGLLAWVPFVPVIIWRLLDEEKFLAKNLPGYSEYCEKVRYHLLPFVW
jgi:protein-S-isoprenylcysteine O-methyltransferase Ste14